MRRSRPRPQPRRWVSWSLPWGRHSRRSQTFLRPSEPLPAGLVLLAAAQPTLQHLELLAPAAQELDTIGQRMGMRMEQGPPEVAVKAAALVLQRGGGDRAGCRAGSARPAAAGHCRPQVWRRPRGSWVAPDHPCATCAPSNWRCWRRAGQMWRLSESSLARCRGTRLAPQRRGNKQPPQINLGRMGWSE